MIEISPLLALPVTAAVAMLLLLPAAIGPAARANGAAITLGTALFTSFATLVMLHRTGAALSDAELLFTTLALLAASCVAAPLLDRARAPGLLVAASVAGLGIVYTTLQYLAFALPVIGRAAMLPSVLIAALAVGIAGGMMLPLHPQRIDAEGRVRLQAAAAPGVILAGWALLALTLAGFTYSVAPATGMLPLFASAMSAGFITLCITRADDAWQKTGEAMAAGVLIALLTPLSLEAASVLGLVAGFFVLRSEAITQSLRIDDPHHMMGALFIPAMLGLIMPGIADYAQLAPHLLWLGSALALATLTAALLWPITMLTLGLALPPRLMRASVPAR